MEAPEEDELGEKTVAWRNPVTSAESDRWVEIFSSRDLHAEIESKTIHGLLESAGLSSIIVRENVQAIPVGKVGVRVPASEEQEARALLAEARRNPQIPDEQDGLEGNGSHDA